MGEALRRLNVPREEYVVSTKLFWQNSKSFYFFYKTKFLTLSDCPENISLREPIIRSKDWDWV